jgi:hypothetical protein
MALSISGSSPSFSSYQGGTIISGAAVASTSGASIDFTSIPSWVKRVTVMFQGVSTNSTSPLLVQLGYSGSVESTGYASTAGIVVGDYVGAAGANNSTSGFLLQYINVSPAQALSGQLVLTNLSGNTWVCNGMIGTTSTGWLATGAKTLSSTLSVVRITTSSGTPVFDAGSINILFE